MFTSLVQFFRGRSASPVPQAQDKTLARVYSAYTTEFDSVLDASELGSAIEPLTPFQELQLNKAWDDLQFGLLSWKTKMLVKAAETSERIRNTLTQNERENIVVSLLLDHSGSMKGQKMAFASVALDQAQEFLSTLSIRVEVLGFTTSKWKGGRSRKRWNSRLRPRNPGRLNDLLHIIYRRADDNRTSSGGYEFRQMLRPDLPKENIDGEAIEWAAGRLLEREEQRKILIVLSDGASVDDSTLSANGPTYLEDHLRRVVGEIEEKGSLTLGAIGIGFSVARYYRRSAQAINPDELGITLLNFLEELLVQSGHSPCAAI